MGLLLGSGMGWLGHQAQLREERELVVVQIPTHDPAGRVEPPQLAQLQREPPARARHGPPHPTANRLPVAGDVPSGPSWVPVTVNTDTTASPASRYLGSVIRMSLEAVTQPGRKSALNSPGVRNVRPWE